MYNFVYDLIKSFDVKYNVDIITVAVMAFVIAVICIVVRAIIKVILVHAAKQIQKVERKNWVELSLQNKIPQRLSNIVIPVIISYASADIPDYLTLLDKSTGIAGIIVFLLLFNALIRTFGDIYVQHEVSKTRPIKGLLQVLQIVVFIITGIVGIAIILGQSPVILLGGIGAAAAVISFVFKDPILGFVAGIQLTANDMVRIGDWIEMPKYSADGDVIEISMTTVKVRNFDNTITSIPAYTLVSDSFVNWRGMAESGGRRIKRSIYIDVNEIALCDDKMIDRLKKIDILNEYVENKLSEIEKYNKNQDFDASEVVNVRQITNIGTFRAYMTAYLKKHPEIHKGMTIMVRQLASDERGIPLEVYAFTATTSWEDYEAIQADIFDHFYSVASAFGLKVYQKPSGSDIRSGFHNIPSQKKDLSQ